ncbi:MAG: peptidoglycan bridge formation glycyltransferase FemA/FemB family protein [Candidatus Margulisiibacteriota bacterium]
MKLCEDIDRQRWDEFIANSPHSPILQTYGWGEVKKRQGWTPIRLAIVEGNNILAGVQLLKRNLPYVGRSIFYAPRGPVVDFGSEDMLDTLLRAIEAEAKKHKAILLKIDPEIEEGEKSIFRLLMNHGFCQQKKQIQPRTTIYLDLTKGLKDLLKSFEEKTRYNIRLSAKKGVTVREFSNEEGVNIFYEIYKETSSRDNFLIHKRSYYEKIKEELVDRGMAQIFIAYLGEEPIAGVFTFTCGPRIWYMYGASSNEYRNVMPNHALHWHVIQWAKACGYKVYDLWGIPSDPKPGHPLWGVYRFKKGFNGEVVKLVGACDLVYDPFYNFIFNGALGLYKNARSLITKGKIIDSLEE